jgi:lysozyme family protein
MANYDSYFELENKLEGVVYENHPNDTAGATKFGLVIDDLDEYNLDLNKDGKIDWQDVKELTKEDAYKVLKKLYWDFFRADDIKNDSLGKFIVDGGLTMGRVLIAKYLQGTICTTIDGKIGDRTINAINLHPNQHYIFQSMYNKRKERYDKIIERNPSQEVFRNGWYNRLNAIKFVK